MRIERGFTIPQCLKIIEKVLFNIASEASNVYIWNGQKLTKNAKNGPFERVFENLICGQRVLPDRSMLFSHNVNLARFARNVECDFFYDFQTLCYTHFF